ncbi:glycosyl transferase [Aureococcus anophagefferens]|nr:glycosyl transferase [Aureococcus anophagefferens]
MGSLLLLALLARCAAAAEEGLAVALHAQAYPVEGGVIVGSVMTTNGLKRALLRSGRVRVARSFYPFHYGGIADEAWDLVIIEGWFEMSNAFIHEVRRLRPAVVVLYWCLDPHFPGLDAIGSLDVDGYLTNSATVAATLGNVAPAEVVNLAANLVGILREAAASSLGLELWGAGWADVGPDDLKRHYRGILPHGALAACYGNASAVIGATMDGQRAAGMVNNRVFEALATGAPLVMETSCARHGCLRVAVVWSGEWTPQFGSSFGAAADLLATRTTSTGSRASPTTSSYDAVWAVGPSAAPRTCARGASRATSRRRGASTSGACSCSSTTPARPARACGRTATSSRPANYDGVTYVAAEDAAALEAAGFRPLTLQQGYGVALLPGRPLATRPRRRGRPGDAASLPRLAAVAAAAVARGDAPVAVVLLAEVVETSRSPSP